MKTIIREARRFSGSEVSNSVSGEPRFRSSGWKWLSILPLILLGAGLHNTCLGQGTLGGISGHVTDQSGASIPGASIHVTNMATNVSTDVTTSETGDYSVH